MGRFDIEYRIGTIRDREGILRLFQNAFAMSEVSEKDESLWNWQMLHNPEGEPIIGLALYNNDIVGHYAVMPYNYINETGRIVRVGLVVDVMVHPDYQGKGIFVGLSKFTLYEAVNRFGIEFAIGYPYTGTTYSKVIPGHKKVGWKELDRLTNYILPIRTDRIIRHQFSSISYLAKTLGALLNLMVALEVKLKSLRFKNSLTDGHELSLQETIQFNETDLKLIGEYSQRKFIKKRSSDFLSWRFIKKPAANYKILRITNVGDTTLAFLLLRICMLSSLKMGVVIDMISSCDNENNYFLLKAGIDYFKQNDCDGILLLDYARSDLSTIRDSLGFINTRQYYQIINWQRDETVVLPKLPRVNWVDFDIF